MIAQGPDVLEISVHAWLLGLPVVLAEA